MADIFSHDFSQQDTTAKQDLFEAGYVTLSQTLGKEPLLKGKAQYG
jgi:hypothetical protein